MILDQNLIYNAMKYKYNRQYYYNRKQTFFTANWTQANNKTSLAITYYHTLDSDLEITLKIFNEDNSLITSTTLEKFVSN